MTLYKLPKQLDNDIAKLETLIEQFKAGEISSGELKAYRVPSGVYEQRENDTYMLRIRCPGGIITPTQLQKVVEISEKYGKDCIHLTTRQEVQVHYLKLDDIIPAIYDAKEANLAARGGGGNTFRNVITAEDAGIDPLEYFDVTPYVLELTNRMIAEDDSWTMPRKYKIAFSGSDQDKGFASVADLGFIAQVKDGKKGFKVFVAGGYGSSPQPAQVLHEFVDESEVYAITKAIKLLFWKKGNRKNKHKARLRYLWRELGRDEFISQYESELSILKKDGVKPLDIEHIDNSLTGSITAKVESNDKSFINWKKRYLQEQKQSGLFSLLVPIKLGFIDNSFLLKLAIFLKPLGDNVIRLTKDQNILLRNLDEESIKALYVFLKNNLESFSKPLLYDKLVSCAGAATCRLGFCLSRGLSDAIFEKFDESDLDLDVFNKLRINISGCPNSCGQHPLADIGFYGKALRKNGKMYPAYSVVIGGVISSDGAKYAKEVATVSARDIPDFLISVLKDYQQVGELDKTRIKALADKYIDIPDFAKDKNYYFDWGAEELFSVASRGQGECSAGIFDLIDIDLDYVKKAEEEKNIDKLLFYGARALLITKGVEPKHSVDVYEEFKEHFLKTGLVDSNFESLLDKAIDNKLDSSDISEALNLTKRVEYLYSVMDNSMQFKVANKEIQKEKVVEPSNDQVLVKDLKGVSCPMNFVKTKLELSKLNKGDYLEVILDDGEPIENVPGSVRSEGHEIVSQTQEDGCWKVLIRKG